MMIKLVLWVIAAIAALLVQPRLTLFETPLNLSLVVVYAFGIRNAVNHPAASGSADVSAEIRATMFGAFIGLMEDGMTGTIIGPNVLSKGIAGFISSFVFRDVFFRWDSALGGTVLCFLTILDGVLSLGTRLVFTNLFIGTSAVAELILLQAIMNIPVGLLIKPVDRDAPQEHLWFQRRRYN